MRLSMNPLKPPKQWPPPIEPPPTDLERWWSRLPVIGLVPSWYLAGRRRNRYLWNVLEPIEKLIVAQLAARHDGYQWPSESHAEIAHLISIAIGSEKHINPPTIIRDDPLDLLFWGAYDDMTPLAFSLAFKRRFGLDISWPQIVEFIDNRKTVGDFINWCVLRVNAKTELAT